MSKPRFIKVHRDGLSLPTYINIDQIQSIEFKKNGCILRLHNVTQSIQESADDVLEAIRKASMKTDLFPDGVTGKSACEILDAAMVPSAWQLAEADRASKG